MKVRNTANREMVVDLGEQWEPYEQPLKKAPMYENVTDACEVSPTGHSIETHGGACPVAVTAYGIENGYRLEKVYLWHCPNGINGMTRTGVDAFILQKVKQ